MTYYDFIKQNELIINDLMKMGIVPITIISHLEYYSYYRGRLATVSNWKAIQDTAIEFNVSDKTINRVVNRLSSEIGSKI